MRDARDAAGNSLPRSLPGNFRLIAGAPDIEFTKE
jgi:hypothetical protein